MHFIIFIDIRYYKVTYLNTIFFLWDCYFVFIVYIQTEKTKLFKRGLKNIDRQADKARHRYISSNFHYPRFVLVFPLQKLR